MAGYKFSYSATNTHFYPLMAGYDDEYSATNTYICIVMAGYNNSYSATTHQIYHKNGQINRAGAGN